MNLADFLVPVTPAIDPALIDGRALDTIRHLAARLPARFGLGLFGFECDLGDPRPVADFLVSCTRRTGGPALLATASPHPAVARFADAWDVRFDDVWLEYDVVRGATRTPSLFFSPAAWRGPACTTQTRDGLRALGTEASSTFDRIVAAIPDHAGLFQVGRMLARAGTPVRLCVGPMLPDVAAGFLDAIEHPASASARDALRRLGPLVDALAVGLDLTGDTLAPRLGIECYRKTMMLARADGADLPLFDALGDACIAAKVAGLGRYVGYASVVDMPREWPPSLQAPARYAADGSESFLVRKLHHVKVVLDGDAPLRVKAYLAVQHRWRTPDATAEQPSRRS